MITTLNDRLATRRRRLSFESATINGMPIVKEFAVDDVTARTRWPTLPPPVTPNYLLPHYRLGRAQPPPYNGLIRVPS